MPEYYNYTILGNCVMKLLIIDDDRVSTFITAWVAKDSGIFNDIQSVANGRKALDFFEEVCKGAATAPDLILVDLNMPVMNGFEFIERLKQLPFACKKSMSIVILSSSDNAIDVERARSLGIKHYLLKSLSLKDLRRSLSALYRKTTGASTCHKADRRN